MASVFISHSSRDEQAATELHDWLTEHDYQRTFLDFHPEDGIPPGRSWEHEIYARLRQCDAVVCLLTPAAEKSKWVFAEIAIARSLNRRVLTVRQSGVELPSMLAPTQAVGWNGRLDTDAIGRGLEGFGLSPLQWDPQNPYPGIKAFGLGDAGVFVGREEEIRELRRRLGSSDGLDSRRVVSVSGPSGSGKSSLVASGLRGQLEYDDEWLTLDPFEPGPNPIGSVARLLAEATLGDVGADRLEQERERLLGRLKGDGGASYLSERLRDLAVARGRPGAQMLLIVDELEQLVTPHETTDAHAFLALLDDAAHEQGSPLRLALVFRSEYVGTLQRIAPAGLLDPFPVEPLDAASLERVIVYPAERVGLRYDPGLVGRIVAETTGGDALPLLAYALRRLYEQAGDDKLITVEEYDAVGGVLAAVSEAAQKIYDRCPDQARLLEVLLVLVTVIPHEEPLKRRQTWASLDEVDRELLEPFVEARLVTRSGEVPSAVVAAAHLALFRVWEPLVEKIETERELLETRTELESTAAEWDATGRRPERSLRSWRLQEALGHIGHEPPIDGNTSGWLDQHERQLGEPVTALLKQSVDEHRKARLWKGIRIGALAVVALVLAGLLGAFLVELREEADRRKTGAAETVALSGSETGDFELDVHEVTYLQWRACMDAGQCSAPRENQELLPPTGGIREAPDDLPVVFVNGFQAAQFCSWIDRRLPTRAELELAARGEQQRQWPWGDDNLSPQLANVGSDGPVGHLAGEYAGGDSPEGLRHLIGNVAEWTATTPGSDDTWNGSDAVPSLVAVGLGWADTVVEGQFAFEGLEIQPSSAAPHVGLRCAT